MSTADPSRRAPSRLMASMAVARLAAATARAAGMAPPRLHGSGRCRLEQFARFSRDVAESALSQGTTDPLSAALRAEAWTLGRRLRRILGIRGHGRGLSVACRLYRLMGIDLAVDGEGNLAVTQCIFSGVYTPEVCGVMSAMDEGILAGLAGEGHLSFTHRITEGHATCRGRFTRRGQ